MGWPQVTWIALAAAVVAVAIAKHEAPRKVDAWTTMIRVSVVGALLYAGGFFA